MDNYQGGLLTNANITTAQEIMQHSETTVTAMIAVIATGRPESEVFLACTPAVVEGASGASDGVGDVSGASSLKVGLLWWLSNPRIARRLNHVNRIQVKGMLPLTLLLI